MTPKRKSLYNIFSKLISLKPLAGIIMKGPAKTRYFLSHLAAEGTIQLKTRLKIAVGTFLILLFLLSGVFNYRQTAAARSDDLQTKIDQNTSSPEATVEAGNSIYRIFVNDSTPRVGRYTAQTGPAHPATNPSRQNVLFGGGVPGTSFNSIRSYTTGITYVQGPVPAGPNIVNLDPFTTGTTVTTTGITTHWTLPGSETAPDTLEIIQEINVIGTTFADSKISVKVTVVNNEGSPVSLGFRYLWDFQIGLDDGPTFQANPGGDILVTEELFEPPGFNSYKVEDNDRNTNPPTFNVLGSVSADGSPQSDRIDYADWPMAQVTAFDYNDIDFNRNIAEEEQGSNDSSVLYFFGRDSSNAILVQPGDSQSVIEELFLVIAQPCVIICPEDITVANDPGECGAIVAFPDPELTSGCDVPTCTPASETFFPIGTTTVTCMAMPDEGGGGNLGPNGDGQSTTCSFTVTVVDTEPPAITCPKDIVVDAGAGSCSGIANYPLPNVSDNCPGVTMVCLPPSGTVFPPGASTVTCTATDFAGNKSTCTFTVTVRDSTPPTITSCPPASITVDAGGDCTAPAPDLTHMVTATDSCTPVASLVVTQTPAPGMLLRGGANTITIKVTDSGGNSASCTVTANVTNARATQLQVNPNPVKLNSVKLFKFKKRKNRAKVRAAAATSTTFTITNPAVEGCSTPLTLTVKALQRVTNRNLIGDPDDRQFFTVFRQDGTELIGQNTPPGQVITLGVGETKTFSVEFDPQIPAVPRSSAQADKPASSIVPDSFRSELVFNEIADTVMFEAGVNKGVKLINPNNPSGSGVVTICRSGDTFTVRFFVYDSSKSDVQMVKYDFLDSAGNVIASVESSLAGAISQAVINGQSFFVEQDFSGANSNGGVAKVRVTVTGTTSDSATSDNVGSGCNANAQLLLIQRSSGVFLPTIDLRSQGH